MKEHLPIRLLVAITLLFSAELATAQGWFNINYLYRTSVIIANPGSTTLTGFQTQISLTSGNFDFTKARSDGADVIVTGSDGVTLIPFWRESWNSAGQQGSVWVKLYTLPGSGSDTVYVYYGNPSGTLPAVEVPPTGPFTRAADNPIPGSSGLLAENMVFDTTTGHYWLLYSTTATRVGLMYSDNPTTAASWHVSGGGAGIVIDSAFAPHILKYNGTWYIFYAERKWNNGHHFDISVATASSITGPYTYQGSPVTKGGSGSWESYRADEPYVFQREDGKWMIVYMGETGLTDEQTGYATADNILGPYTKYAANPLIRFGNPGSYDAGTCADPWVYDFHGVYYIGYTVSSTNASPWQTACAVTTDWVNISKVGVILPLGTGADASNSFRGAVSRFGSTYLFPYTNDSYQMAIATQPVNGVPAVNDSTAIFDFYDDFIGTSLNTNKWSYASGGSSQVSLSGGVATLTASSSTYIKLNATTAFGTGYVVETRARHPQAGQTNDIAEWGWTAAANFNDCARMFDDFPSLTNWEKITNSTKQVGITSNMTQLSDVNYHIFRVYRTPIAMDTSSSYQVDNNAVQTDRGSVSPTINLYPFLMAYWASPASTCTMLTDWVRVRKWAGTNPTITVGTGQNESPPPAPLATSATNITTSGFTANWNSSTGATSYALDVATDIGFTSMVSGYSNLSVAGLTQAVTGLSQNTDYYYRVRAVNVAGSSSNSNTITVTTIGSHIITATAGSHGAITPNGSVVVAYGADTTFTITPNSGCHIVSVLVDGVPQGVITSYTFHNVIMAHTMSATFALNQFTLTVSATGAGTVGLSPNQTLYDSGSVVQLTATASAGYRFLNWSGAVSGSVNPLSVTMNSNKSITANFVIFVMSIGIEEGVNDLSAGINAAAVDGVGLEDTVSPPPRPSDYVYVYFPLAPGAPLPNYSVDVKKDEASLSGHAKRWPLVTISDILSTPDTLQFMGATLPPGFVPVLFDLQSGKYQDVRTYPAFTYTSPSSQTAYNFMLLIGDSTKPVVTLTAPIGGESLVANTPDTIRWISSDGTGLLRHYIYCSLTGAPPYTLIDSTNGNVDSLIWIPATGAGSARIRVVAMDSVMNQQTDSSHSVFSIGHMITSTAGNHGLISPSGSMVVAHGADQSYTITPDLGYHVDSLIVDGASQPPALIYAFHGVSASHTIRVTFAITTYQLTVAATSGGSISAPVTSPATVNYGNATPLTASPNRGYHFTSWTLVAGSAAIADTSAMSTTAILTIGDAAIRANFVINTYVLTVNAGTNGSVTLTPPGGTYTFGTIVHLAANPNTWFHFVNWSGSLTSPDNPDSIILDTNEAVIANFAVNQYALTTVANAGWNLLSLPVQQPDMTPAGVFGSAYGTTPYYVFQYGNSSFYTIPSTMNMGQGYWLGSTSGPSITATGMPLTSATVPLGQGYNIVGDPFLTNEPLDSLRFSNGIQSLTLTAASDSGWLSPVLYKYTGSGYAYESTDLAVWEGCWIPILLPGISIDYAPVVAAPGMMPKQRTPVPEQTVSTRWNVDLTATLVSSNGKKCNDEIASFGVRKDATSGFDSRYDVPRPPRSPNEQYVEVGFPETGASYPKLFGTTSYVRDFKSPETPSWEFVVSVSGRGGDVTLSWSKDAVSTLGPDVRIILCDMVQHKLVDMKKVNSYTYVQTEPTRKFTVNGGKNLIPTSYRLEQNFPNPFNPTTVINYELPRVSPVLLEIYNIVGERVATLVSEKEDAGYHSVSWNGRDEKNTPVSSGIYIYRLNAGNFTSIKKMLLLK